MCARSSRRSWLGSAGCSGAVLSSLFLYHILTCQVAGLRRCSFCRYRIGLAAFSIECSVGRTLAGCRVCTLHQLPGAD
jgi:hypothetical protein